MKKSSRRNGAIPISQRRAEPRDRKTCESERLVYIARVKQALAGKPVHLKDVEEEIEAVYGNLDDASSAAIKQRAAREGVTHREMFFRALELGFRRMLRERLPHVRNQRTRLAEELRSLSPALGEGEGSTR